MADSCCNLVGNFDISAQGIISISAKGATEVQMITANAQTAITIAPSEGTVSLSAYASFECHSGCPGKAGVSVPWIKKTDCNNYKFLHGGYGKSTLSGDVANLAAFPDIDGIINPVSSYKFIDASSSSGPAAQYNYDTQYDGYGLVYHGLPWSIDTSTEDGCKVNLTSYGIGDYGECFLQNINLQCTPGQLPIVNMDFIYSIVTGE